MLQIRFRENEIHFFPTRIKSNARQGEIFLRTISKITNDQLTKFDACLPSVKSVISPLPVFACSQCIWTLVLLKKQQEIKKIKTQTNN